MLSIMADCRRDVESGSLRVVVAVVGKQNKSQPA